MLISIFSIPKMLLYFEDILCFVTFCFDFVLFFQMCQFFCDTLLFWPLRATLYSFNNILGLHIFLISSSSLSLLSSEGDIEYIYIYIYYYGTTSGREAQHGGSDAYKVDGKMSRLAPLEVLRHTGMVWRFTLHRVLSLFETCWGCLAH